MMLRMIKRVIVINLILVGAAKLASKMLPDTRDAEAEEFELTSILEESSFVTVSTDLARGNVTTLYGATSIDLRSAELDSAGATINVNTAFGFTEINIPEGWNLALNNSAIAGSVENRAVPADGSSPTLGITGYTVCGHLLIRN